MTVDGHPTVLVIGGLNGLVGRALRTELGWSHQLRSAHRHPDPDEAAAKIPWIPLDLTQPFEWRPHLDGVNAIVNVAWYRAGPADRFRRLADGLIRLIDAAQGARVSRFVQVSVPAAPSALESGLPYLVEKRRVDRALIESGLSYSILRPSALFGPGDRLLGVMVRTMARYRMFPMFGNGEYRISPIAVSDLARIVRRALEPGPSTVQDLGGPRTFRYRELTDGMFAALGKPPRYWRLSERGGHRLAALLETFGSTLLYAYEVDWLVSDMLGLPSAEDLAPGLTPVEPYLASEAARWTRRPTSGPPSSARRR